MRPREPSLSSRALTKPAQTGGMSDFNREFGILYTKAKGILGSIPSNRLGESDLTEVHCLFPWYGAINMATGGIFASIGPFRELIQRLCLIGKVRVSKACAALGLQGSVAPDFSGRHFRQGLRSSLIIAAFFWWLVEGFFIHGKRTPV
jgi:hypothetical protein